MFVNRMETVQKLKFSMKVIKMEEITPIHHRYDVQNSVKSRTSYNCHIGLQPSCSCSDYALHGSDVYCKHILFVLYFGLNVTDFDVLKDVSFSQDVVEELLAKTFDKDLFREKKSLPRPRKSSSEILKSHKNFNDKQIATYHLKGRQSAKCKGNGCNQIFQIGTPCVKVDGVLTVPYGKDFAVKQPLYFCPSPACLSRPPVWTNVQFPTEVVQGPGISDDQLEKLNTEIEAFSSSE